MHQDFFYVCPAHLKDKGFCSPIIDEAAVAAKKKREMEAEVQRIKQEFEEKQKKKKEKDQEKESQKDKDTKDEKKDEKKPEEKVARALELYLTPGLTICRSPILQAAQHLTRSREYLRCRKPSINCE